MLNQLIDLPRSGSQIIANATSKMGEVDRMKRRRDASHENSRRESTSRPARRRSTPKGSIAIRQKNNPDTFLCRPSLVTKQSKDILPGHWTLLHSTSP